MKKIAMVLVFALIAALGFAEAPVEETAVIAGTVIGITDEGYLISNSELGEVMILVNEETVTDANGDIACGDYISADYSGMMTRSLPPQLTASVIRMYVVEGDVVEIMSEENCILMDTAEYGEIIVNLPEGMPAEDVTDTHIKVYFDGAMTMSLPAQISAALVIPGYTISGSITEITDGYILLGEGVSAVQVNYSEGMLPEGLETGDAVIVTFDGMMTRSIPAQVNASAINIIGAETSITEEQE